MEETCFNLVDSSVISTPMQNYPPGFEPNCKITGKKRPFSSFNSPESFIWWRKVSALKTKPSSTDKIKKNPPQLMKNFTQMPNKNGGKKGDRERLKEILAIFREKCRELSRIPLQKRETHRIDFEAMRMLNKEGKIPKKVGQVLGSIPGVEIGDRFEYRVELMIAGLHRRNQNGIDFTTTVGGAVVATRIVATEGYMDQIDSNEILSYVGEGGMYDSLKDGVCHKDRKMIRGNLALKNSIVRKNDVRVVKGVKFGTRFGNSGPKMTYVYDGLYKVVEYKEKKSVSGNVVFEFKLRRNPGQPVVPWHKFKNY